MSFSVMFSGRLNRQDMGPSSVSISLRFCMSVLFIAPIRGAAIV